MIFNITSQPSATDPLVRHIHAELAAAGIPAAAGAPAADGAPAAAGAPAAEAAQRHTAAAEAVAEFLRQEGQTAAVGTEYLLMLTARALWAVGDEPAARRLVHAGGRALNFSPHYAEAACSAGVKLSDWAAFFASRAVRPAAFPSLGGDTLWILDMPKLIPARAPGLELTVLRAMHAALTRLADVWDGSRGRGLLGLSRLRQAAGMILGAPPSSRKSRRLAAEMTRHCWAWLRTLGLRRGWETTPTLISLDLS